MTRRRPSLRTSLIFGTIAVLVVLAGLGVTYVGTVSGAEAQADACQAEYQSVQGALDGYRLYHNLESVTASRGTHDMTSPVLLYIDNTSATIPTFVRNSQTQWSYAWDSSGRITAIMARPGGPSVPPGCTVTPSG